MKTLPSRVPWDASLPKDDGNDVPNEPSPEGAALGRKLAQLAVRAEAEQREIFPNMLPCCSDCALREGTTPNQCMSTLGDVVKCVVEGTPFYCHKGVKEGDQPKRLCTGAMVLMSTVTLGRARARQQRNARKRERRQRRESGR
jgi:hypothetical protein